MLEDCSLGKNTIANIKAGTDVSIWSFTKIADYLDCSTDYLLGRTDNPEVNR